MTDRGLWRRVYQESGGFRWKTFVLLLLEFAATPLFLLSPVPLAIVVDSVLGDGELPGLVEAILPADVSTNGVLLFAAFLQVAVVLLTDLQLLLSGVLRTHTSEHLTLGLRARIFRHVQRLSFSFHDRRGTADSVYRIQYDAQALGNILVSNLVPLLASLVTLASVLVVFIRVDAELAWLALAISPVLAILSGIARKRLRRQYKESKRLESDAMGIVHEVLGSFRVVKAFGREDAEQTRFVGMGRSSAEKKVAIAGREALLDLLINLVTAVGTGLVLYVGAQRVQAGAITLGELLIVVNYLARLYSPLKSLARRVVGFQRTYESLQRTFELLDQQPEVEESPDARPIGRLRGDILLDGVSFAYEPGTPILESIDLEIPAGSRVGIAGRTGAGKTTLVSLLLRFYDVDAGRILLDGLDVREYRLADLRNQFAVVLQEPVLFSTSIAENIAYGRPEASVEEIEAAAVAAGAHEFIVASEDGYQTMVGERGQSLSGGERQRISLARAFLKDAPILVLDEPTSSVDTKTEAAIMEAMERLMQGRTTLMIAHRLSTLDSCDFVVHVDGGAVGTRDPGRSRPLLSDHPSRHWWRVRTRPGSRPEREPLPAPAIDAR